MPQISPSAVVAVFHEPEGAHVVAAALSSLSVLLAKPGDAPAPNATVYDVISKAKREWERTVDTLDHLVFLLDRKGDVLRANRAIERWGLCDVGEVRGLSIHSVLHPSCDEPSCRLERLLTCRWKQVRSRGPTSFEIFDEQLNMAMQLTLQPISEPDSDTEPSDSSYGIVVVEDVTESHQTQTKLRQLNDELSVRVRDRTKQLQAMNRDLAEQISKREIAEQQVQASRDELQRLSARLLKTQEAERRRIALELHDSVGQSLGALKYSLERYIALSGNPELGNAEQALDSAVKQLQTAIEDTRSIAMSLRPSLLDDMGAVSAIRWLCRRFAETYVDIHVIADCNLGDQDVPERLVTTVFRIVQEALSNVAKHSQARSVMVALRRYTRTLALEVRDDGVGFDTRSCDLPSGQCLGIVGMRERAALTGGKFALISGPSVSTRVRVEWEVSD
jgi:signal transduction histidine kinase